MRSVSGQILPLTTGIDVHATCLTLARVWGLPQLREPSLFTKKRAHILEMQPTKQTSAQTPTLAIAGVALLGPALGVATELLPQALLLLALAALLIISPPRCSPGPAWLTLFSLVGLLALTAFLPARWFPLPEWRRVLQSEYSVNLPDTLSPQPWMSFHSVCLLAAGAIFALYVIAHPWRSQNRRTAIQLYAAGIVVLALIAIASTAAGFKVPFWPDVANLKERFGFFPNRNQTANVLALAGIASIALAFESFEARRKAAWLWVAAVLVLGIAAVMAYSRAGILLFFGGVAAWVVVSLKFGVSRKSATLVVAGAILALTLFFLLGGKTFERFQTQGQPALTDMRLPIHADALRFSKDAPWLGQGIGNFADVFPMAREASAGQNRAIHPESDWLWAAVELGWPATLLIAACIALWMRQCFPFSGGSDRLMRSAAMTCGAAFVLHAFGDVSGHRPGSTWPAIFLAGLAMAPDRQLETRRWVAPVFRTLGVLISAVGIWWIASIYSEQVGRVAPTPATLDRLAQRMDRETAAKNNKAVVTLIDEALRIRPLEAELYNRRAIARLASGLNTDIYYNPQDTALIFQERVEPAKLDFETARFLEPRWIEICFLEGKAWLTLDKPSLAFDAWAEAWQRARKSDTNALPLYRRMLEESRLNYAIRSELAQLVTAGPDYFLAFIGTASRVECDIQIERLLDAEPTLGSLAPAQRNMLFRIWFERGDKAQLIAKLKDQPDWQKDGWQWLAMDHADRQDYEHAYKLARQYGTAPNLPPPIQARPVQELAREFYSHPSEIHIGIQLFRAQRASGLVSEALETIEALDKIPGRPSYIPFLESELRAERGEWKAAWEAWRRFGGTKFP